MVRRLVRSDRAGLQQLLHKAVVAGDLPQRSLAQQVGARVAGPQAGEMVAARQHDHDGRCHQHIRSATRRLLAQRGVRVFESQGAPAPAIRQPKGRSGSPAAHRRSCRRRPRRPHDRLRRRPPPRGQGPAGRQRHPRCASAWRRDASLPRSESAASSRRRLPFLGGSVACQRRSSRFRAQHRRIGRRIGQTMQRQAGGFTRGGAFAPPHRVGKAVLCRPAAQVDASMPAISCGGVSRSSATRPAASHAVEPGISRRLGHAARAVRQRSAESSGRPDPRSAASGRAPRCVAAHAGAAGRSARPALPGRRAARPRPSTPGCQRSPIAASRPNGR